MKKPWIEIIPNILYKCADAGEHASVYFVRDADKAVVIDPSIGPFPLPEGVALRALLLTHAHCDHCWAVDAFRVDEAVPLYIHVEDAAPLLDPVLNASQLFGRALRPAPASDRFDDGDVIAIGETLSLTVFHTPGHSAGSSCLLLQENERQRPLALFSGDTLFRGSMGRTDLPGSDPARMQSSLRRLKELMQAWPDDLPILAGHGPGTTVRQEFEYNPFLAAV